MTSLPKLVRFAFKVGATSPSITQARWEELLRAAGADLKTARRIIFFAPNTAARVWLGDQQVKWLSDDYTVRGLPPGAQTQFPLASEPVFEACMLAAQQCSRGRLHRIYLRSATANAIRALGKSTGLRFGATDIDANWFYPSEEAATAALAAAKPSWRVHLQLLFS